jgi:hypothetical protein
MIHRRELSMMTNTQAKLSKVDYGLLADKVYFLVYGAKIPKSHRGDDEEASLVAIDSYLLALYKVGCRNPLRKFSQKFISDFLKEKWIESPAALNTMKRVLDGLRERQIQIRTRGFHPD